MKKIIIYVFFLLKMMKLFIVILLLSIIISLFIIILEFIEFIKNGVNSNYLTELSKKNGVITRGIGKNVSSNRLKTSKEINGYKSLMCMRNALITDREFYNTLVRGL